MYKINPERIKIIPNGAEDVFYNDEPHQLHSPARLLFVGRLGYQKNLPMLLSALEGMSDKFDTTIVGEGDQEAMLKHLVKELQLKNVTFTGRLEGEKLLKRYRESDIFVLPSEREGMPLVLLEAMAMGLPVVATNVTGSRDVIKDQLNGLLVPYNDIAAFQTALLNIISEKKRYAQMSKASRTLADNYSWDKVTGRIEKLYKEAA